jgi:hydroxyquinol 1,2-dioxygenase
MDDPSRIRALVPALADTLRTFCRSHEVRNEELHTALDFLVRVGRADEMILLSDVLWLSILVDEQTHAAGPGEAQSNVAGPLHRVGAPLRTDLSHGPDDGEPFEVTIETVDCANGAPLAAVEVDLWQPARNGRYDCDDPAQPEWNLRGRAHTGTDGRVTFHTVFPGAYEVPKDGPVGELLRALGRPAFRPAHVHVKLARAGYKPLTTIAYFAGDTHLASDVIRSVKPSQVNDVRREGGRAFAALRYPLAAVQ